MLEMTEEQKSKLQRLISYLNVEALRDERFMETTGTGLNSGFAKIAREWIAIIEEVIEAQKETP